MKKVISILSLFAILCIPVFATPNVDLCVQPKGELLGTINQLEAQGYTLTSISCTPILYFVQPSPPYLNAKIHVTMRKIECIGQTGPCALLGTATFTADEIIQNNQGTTRHTNITPVVVAL